MNNNVNNEERKNNGQGIFYAVIGVATLVVTIIGATFAFFSASAGSANNAITASGATISLNLAQNVAFLKGNLIPVDESLSKFGSVIGSAGDETKRCLDDNGNNICSVYQFTVTNPSDNTASQTVYPTLTASANGFSGLGERGTTDLRYAVFKGPVTSVPTNANLTASATATPVSSNYADVNGTIVSDGTLIIKNTETPSTTTPHTSKGSSDTLDNMRITLARGQSITYTIVLWLSESGKQQNYDQGKQFAAGIRFDTSSGTGGVTGVLSTSG